MRRSLEIGTGLIVLAVVLAVVTQAVSGQWFPPPISISQYGVGPNGWIFSLWALCLAGAPLVLQQAMPRRSRVGSIFLLIGAIGTAVMAIVRTDAGGAQASINAKIHMVGSILALGFVPVGAALFLWACGRWWARLAGVILAGLAISLTLLILAAAGYDTAGRGAQVSWVWWQTVAVTLDHIIVASMAVAGWVLARRRARVLSGADRG